MLPSHLVTVWFSHIQIVSATWNVQTRIKWFCQKKKQKIMNRQIWIWSSKRKNWIRTKKKSGTECGLLMINISEFSTWLIKRKSWDTRTRPPSKLLMASAKASMVSMSKWLVGSSSNNICGHCHANQANTTRHLCPSESCLMGAVWNWCKMIGVLELDLMHWWFLQM